MLALQLFTMITCGIIAVQDFQERKVLWICFPIAAILLATLHLNHVGFLPFLYATLTNIFLVSCVLLLLWLVTKFILKKGFLNVSFGLGDMLFMYAFAMGFPSITFTLLFVASIGFSLMAFTLMKILGNMETVPMAGLMGIFLIATILMEHLPSSPSLYLL